MLFNSFKQLIFDAVQTSDFDKFCTLAAKYPSFADCWNKLCTKSGDSVVHLAARSGCVNIIKYYYELGNKTILEQRNLDGKTPLHVAAHSSQLECVMYLLSCKVSVDPLKRADWTPLMLACTKHNLDIVMELLQHGANLNIVNKDGWTAFHIACREGDVQIIKYLLEYNPLVCCTTSRNGRTPLHTAALHGHLDVVKILANEANYDKDVKDSCGTTPFMDAVSGNYNEVVKFLMQKGVSVQETDKLGRNVLHLATEAGNVFCIEHFIKNCHIPINTQTIHGLTPLHFACKENNLESLDLLLSLGADYTLADKQGRTAMEYSTDKEICKRLSAQI